MIVIAIKSDPTSSKRKMCCTNVDSTWNSDVQNDRAKCKGVSPGSFCALGFAPSASKASTKPLVKLLTAARCSGVFPSTSRPASTRLRSIPDVSGATGAGVSSTSFSTRMTCSDIRVACCVQRYADLQAKNKPLLPISWIAVRPLLSTCDKFGINRRMSC